MADATVIDGRKVADKLRKEYNARVESLEGKGVTPGLAVVIVGEDPASQVYVRMKGKACRKMGIHEKTFELPEETSQEQLLELVDRLNGDEQYHGILVQMPLPDHMDESTVIEAIAPSKDVDGLHPVNVGKIVMGRPEFIPCTPHGILELLKYYSINPDGKHAVIVGRSNLVGKPVANLLYQKTQGGNATVTICHTHTEDMAAFTRRADILIVAAGSPQAISADMIKPNATVIDVGVNRVEDTSTEKGYRLVGDVDFVNARKVADYISPVPGGVGPMTITMLLHNTIYSAEKKL